MTSGRSRRKRWWVGCEIDEYYIVDECNKILEEKEICQFGKD